MVWETTFFGKLSGTKGTFSHTKFTAPKYVKG